MPCSTTSTSFIARMGVDARRSRRPDAEGGALFRIPNWEMGPTTCAAYRPNIAHRYHEAAIYKQAAKAFRSFATHTDGMRDPAGGRVVPAPRRSAATDDEELILPLTVLASKIVPTEIARGQRRPFRPYGRSRKPRRLATTYPSRPMPCDRHRSMQSGATCL